MTWLLVHKNTQYACSMFQISTWWLNLLQMLVHWDYTPKAWFACYSWVYVVLVIFVQLHVMELVQYFLIVIVNMEYHIIIFIVRDSVFQIWIISAEFIFSLFLCISVVHGEFDWKICSSPTVCSQFQYESSTGTRHLKLVLGLEFSTGNLDWKSGSSTETHTSDEMVMFLQLPNLY